MLEEFLLYLAARRSYIASLIAALFD